MREGKGPERAEPTSQNRPERFCSKCKTAKVKVPKISCPECNSLYFRILEAKRLLDRRFKEEWDNMDEDKKARFFQLAKQWTKQDLRDDMRRYSMTPAGTPVPATPPPAAASQASFRRSILMEVMKVKAWDDKWYTKAEFIDFYGKCKGRRHFEDEAKKYFNQNNKPLSFYSAKHIADPWPAAGSSTGADSSIDPALDPLYIYIYIYRGLETCDVDIKDSPVTSETLKDAQLMFKTSQALCDTIEWRMQRLPWFLG